MARENDDDLIKIGGRNGDSAEADGRPADLPEIETATPEQAEAMRGPKKAAAVAPAITLKSSGVTVPLEEDAADAPTTAMPRVRGPKRSSAPDKGAGQTPSVRSGGPPAKQPPTSVVAPEPEGSFLERNKRWLIALAIVLAVLLVVGIFLLVKSLTTPESEKITASADGILAPVNGEIDDADKIADFREAAHSARVARGKMTGLQQRANQIGDTRERTATVALLDAQNALLSAYAGLADVRRNNMKPVEDLSDQAKEAARQLTAANAGMTAIDRSGSVDTALTDSAVDNMNDTLADAEAAMAEWTKKFKSQKRKRERFNSQADTLAGFSNQFVAQRGEVGRFYNAPPSETYSTGSDSIKRFESDRSALESSVRSATVEPLLGPARGALAHALDMSVRAFPKLQKAWMHQSRTETVAQSSYFPGYDRATDAVDRNWQIFQTKLAAARAEAKRKYKSPEMPDV